jgi:TolB-like protein/DNA-binding winged helix-turn-helix (wHTH) protein/Tfp pilus assembly protein PilF
MPGDFRLGSWMVRPGLNTIESDGKAVRLEPKAIEVLVCLAENTGETVPKDRLLRAVWGDTFVTEDVLTRCICELRKALEDDPKEPQAIQTIPKRGYRLLLEVGQQGRAQKSANTSAKWRPQWRWTLIVAGLIVLVSTALYFLKLRSQIEPAAEARIIVAVLPFENLSGDPEQEYFSDGMTEELITQLGTLDPQSLAVIGRTSVMRFKHTSKTIAEIGRDLHVTHLLVGSIRRSGERVRISAQLVRAGDQAGTWSGAYDRDLQDVLTIQADVAGGIAHSVGLQLRPEQTQTVRRTDPEAHTLYLKGHYFWNKYDAEGMNKALHYFEEAVTVDPNYAPAYAALANLYTDIGNGHGPANLPPHDAYAKAKAAATQAIRIDPGLADAHAALANLEYSFGWKWAVAETEFQEAIRLNPSSPGFRDGYAFLLATLRRFDEANAQMQKAQELDPLSPMITADVGVIRAMAGDYEKAQLKFRESLELDPNFVPAMWVTGHVYLRQGKTKDAVAIFERAKSALDNTSSNVFLAYAYVMAGQIKRSQQLSRQLLGRRPPIRHFQEAILWSAQLKRERALEALSSAYTEGDPWFSYFAWMTDPFFSSIRTEQRFVELAHRMKIPN